MAGYQSDYGVTRKKSSTQSSIPAATIEKNLRSPSSNYEMQQEAHGTGVPVSEQRATALVRSGYTSGQSVANYQKFLAARGLYKGRIDGVWGPATEAAQKAYRQWYANNQYNQQAEFEKQAAAEAAAARAKILQMSKDAAALLGAKAAAEFAKFADANRYGNQQAIIAAKQVEAQLSSARSKRADFKKKQEGGWGKKLGRVAGKALAPLGYLSEQISSSYYGGKRSQLTGGGLLDQVRASVGGLPGLGAVAGHGAARRAIEETNTRAEREELTRKGELASFGELASGRAYGKLKGKALQQYKKTGANRLPGFVSPTLDAAFQVGTDPLSYLGPASKAAGLTRPIETAGEAAAKSAAKKAGLSLDKFLETNAGKLAEYGGKLKYVRESATGRALTDEILEAAAKATDAKQLERSIKGLSYNAASGIFNSTAAERRAVIEEALAGGRLPLDLAARKQALIKLTGGRLGTGEIVQDGLRAKGGDLLRKIARGDSPRGTLLPRVTSKGRLASTKTGEALDHIIESGLLRSGTGERVEDFVRRVVRPAVEGLDIPERFGRIWSAAEEAGNGAFLDTAERQVKAIITEARKSGVSADDIVNGKTLSGKAGQMLERLEAAAAVIGGDAGDVASKQAGLDLVSGFVPKTTDVFGQVKRAGESLGLSLPRASTVKFSDQEARLLRAEIQTAIRDVDDALADRLIGELDRAAAGNKNLTKLRATVDALKQNPELLDEAGRIALNAERMAAQAGEEVIAPGLGRRALAKAAALPLSFSEARYADKVTFEGRTANTILNASDRVEQLDRWFMGFGMDDFSRGRLRTAIGAVRSEQEMYDLIESVARREAEKLGLDPDVVRGIMQEARAHIHSDKATFILPDGTVTDEVFTLAQLGEAIPMIDPTELRKMLTKLRAENGDLLSKARRRVDELGTRQLGGLDKNGLPVTVRRLLRKGHTEWKFLVVTNFYAGGVGFAGGVVGSDDKSVLGRLKNGLMWGALAQGAAPLRYLLRVAGIEEKARTYFERGLARQEWIPTLSKRARRKGELNPNEWGFMSKDMITSSSAPVDFLIGKNQHLVTADRGWEALGKNQPRYVDSWGRIVNRQIHPETDLIAEVLLKERAGFFTAAQADEELQKFFATSEGKTVLKRLRSGTGNTTKTTVDEIVTKYRAFIDLHFDEQLAETRLAGEVQKETLTQAAKAGRGPEVIHAQKTWIRPRNIREVFALRDRLAGKFILEGPTTKFNREPLAEWLYKERYETLVRNGYPKELAQAEADEFAVRRTNEVMFNINDESRFAAKADNFLPFQQPREEMVRVWAKLVARNPGRAIRLAENGAKAFNAGVDQGMFTKDEFTGDWKLRVPGSGRVSALLGNTIGMESSLKDYLFIGQGAYNVGFLPAPGGPYWTVGVRAFLDTELGKQLYLDMPGSLKEVLFPYGADGQLAPRAANRLWMGLTYSTPPWEFAGRKEQLDVLHGAEYSVAAELMSDYLAKHNGEYPPDLDAFYKNEVVPATKAFLRAWALTTSINPASVRPIYANAQAAAKVMDIYTDQISGKTDLTALFKDHPEMRAFIDGKGKWKGRENESFEDWKKRQSLDFNSQRILRMVERSSGRDYVDNIKEAVEFNKAMTAFQEAKAEVIPLLREAKMQEWREQFPDAAAKFKSSYEKKKELGQILYGYPKGPVQDRALDSWRQHYEVTPGQYKMLKQDIESGRFRTNPWQDARDMEDVYADVRKQMRRGFNEDAYVSTLQPVEQIRYWNQKMLNLSTDSLGHSRGAKSVLDEWYLLKSKQGQVWQAHPFLGGLPKPEPALETAIRAWQGDHYQAIADLNGQLTSISATMKEAANAKNWGVYFQLKPQQQHLFDAIRTLKNKMYHEVPDFPGLQDELRANMVFGEPRGTGGEGDFIFSNEEKSYAKMPPGVRQAYIEDMVDRLEEDWVDPNGYAPGGGRLFWERLTDFQKDLIERNLPDDDVNYFKGLTPGKGKGTGGGGRGFKFTAESNEMGFAIQAFKDWNRRPAGAKPPTAYKAYLELPNDSVVRGAFLKEHPEVRDWLKLGPMANMPPVLRYIVANIMVKYGKWEGEQRDYKSIADLAFAQEQLARFNLRKDKTKPEAYDVWVNMPTGVEKALFLDQHPEVGDWIRLGPMANMPEEYQDVVRDIMLRYGEWTEKDDPLGRVLQGYYKLPQHAREQYLRDHPELNAYWAATRSPEEKVQFQLADQYFAIQDQGAKRFFLLSHPELQDWFISQRTKRYERFLNRVAVYMGSNPDLFEHYLKRQEDILSELLNRFAESPLVREIRPQGAVKQTSTESGRKRSVAA